MSEPTEETALSNSQNELKRTTTLYKSEWETWKKNYKEERRAQRFPFCGLHKLRQHLNKLYNKSKLANSR